MRGARGRLWKHGHMWHYEASINGEVMLTDNCRVYDTLLAECELSVWALNRISGAGYRLSPKNWRGCLDEVTD